MEGEGTTITTTNGWLSFSSLPPPVLIALS